MGMTFAQALNEGIRVIVQQSNRIKTDAGKIKQQQGTIVDQCSIITDQEMKTKALSCETEKLGQIIGSLESKVAQVTVACDQAESVCDRQGERITNLQNDNADLRQIIAKQNEEIAQLRAQCDQFRRSVPSQEDAAALAAMEELLQNKKLNAQAMKICAAPRAEAA